MRAESSRKWQRYRATVLSSYQIAQSLGFNRPLRAWEHLFGSTSIGIALVQPLEENGTVSRNNGF